MFCKLILYQFLNFKIFYTAKEEPYEFKVTPNKGNFDHARAQCAEIKGDLITVNILPRGQKYHKLVFEKHLFIFCLYSNVQTKAKILLKSFKNLLISCKCI